MPLLVQHGGRFGDAFTSSLISNLTTVGANAAGLSTRTLSPKISSAMPLAAAVKLQNRDAASGAIGAAGTTLTNPTRPSARTA